ncbi:MAG: hypothetical protein M3438_07560 [Pseudomonadota bacterium]|nr:hypothetical protein [Pseudomonadota bacterium]
MTHAALLLLASLSWAAPAQPEPVTQAVSEHRNDIGEIERRDDGFLHRSSGFVYPAQLGEMPSRKSRTYGPGDAEVYYSLYGGANNDAWISVFVYPATADVSVEARNVVPAILERFKAVESIGPAGLQPGPAGSREGWFRGSLDNYQMLTGYRLIRSGNWFVKARISIPLAGGEAATKRAVDAVAAIPWTWQATAPK